MHFACSGSSDQNKIFGKFHTLIENQGAKESSLTSFHSTKYFSAVCFFGASQVALVVKNLPANVGDIRNASLIPGSGSFRGAWWAIVYRVTKSWTWLKQLNTYTHTHTHTHGVIFNGCIIILLHGVPQFSCMKSGHWGGYLKPGEIWKKRIGGLGVQ